MANIICASLLKLFYSLTFPFLLMATLLSCSSRPTFCSFFRLKSTTSPVNFSFVGSLQFGFLQSYWHPQRISSCYLPPSLLNALVTMPEPITSCVRTYDSSSLPIGLGPLPPLASPQSCRQLFPCVPAEIFYSYLSGPVQLSPALSPGLLTFLFTFTHAPPLLRIVLSLAGSIFILLGPTLRGPLLLLTHHFLLSIPLVLVTCWLSQSSP